MAHTPTKDSRLTDERKYKDDEVSEIFARATDVDGAGVPARSAGDGLTLAELQEVGVEVGLSPERVAASASALDTRIESVPRGTSLGAPVSVGRVIELPRAATDREWQILIADLRDTFRAKGHITTHGDTRVWANGHLHAFLEPTESGHRLRMGTQKTGSKERNMVGAAGLAIGLVLLVTSGLDAATFGATFETLIPAVIALGGGGMITGNFLRLRSWADKRERQMEHIADRARALLSAPPADEGRTD